MRSLRGRGEVALEIKRQPFLRRPRRSRTTERKGDVKARLQGAALLAICALALHRIYLLINLPPYHQSSPMELLLGLVAVVTGVWGAAFLAIGPALLRPYAWPPADGD
jgi:hypothetical protein